MNLLTCQEIKDLEQQLTEEIGIPQDLLMEHAAVAVASLCKEQLLPRQGKSNLVTVFAGNGKNGQDAMAAARLLSADGIQVTIIDVSDEPVSNSVISLQKRLCISMGIPIIPISDFSDHGADIVIDGIFGVSFDSKRIVSRPCQLAFEAINRLSRNGCMVIAIDLPSGVDADTGTTVPGAVMAHKTVTFFYLKPGLVSYPGKKHAGDVQISRLSVPETVLLRCLKRLPDHQLIDQAFASSLLAPREADGHKGLFGRVGLIGGSRGMPGAVCLSAKAAFRCGCGLVYIRTENESISCCLSVVPEALISSEYTDVITKTDALAAGPGMDQNNETVNRVFELVTDYPKLVLDAAALSVLSEDPPRTKACIDARIRAGLLPLILTPHAGELDRLLPGKKDESRIDLARDAAAFYSSVVVLKGAATVVADPSGRIAVNSSGNSSMAKGGSGDILAGMTAAFYSRMDSPFEAASLSVYLHGVCGDLSAKKFGEYCAMPQDTLDMIPQAFESLIRAKKEKDHE